MSKRTASLCFFVLVVAALALGGCSDVHISVDVGGTPFATVLVEVTTTSTPTSTASVAATAQEPETTAVPGASATPVVEPAAPTSTSVPADQSQSAADPAPTAPPPTATPEPPVPTTTPLPTPTRQRLMPTPPPCASYQGQTYTVVLNEQQINAMLDAVLKATERKYVGTRSVSLQNGQIVAQVQYQGPAGKTVDGTLVLAVTSNNYDLHVSIVQAQVGQAGMTDARKAAINTAFERALETRMAQNHDYTCVDAVTIANGTLTIVYH